MKTQIIKQILLAAIIIWPTLLFAQTITTTPGSVTSCPGGIVVAVNATNCNNVGAISLMLDYNNTVLTYQSYQNLNPQLSSGLLIINSTGNTVIISWASTTPANIGNGVLVELMFNAVPGSSSLNWNVQQPGNCEYSDANGNVLPAAFVNATATIQQPPLINTQPGNKTVLVGQNASISLAATGTGMAYLWQVSTNGGGLWTDLSNNTTYSGVTTGTLGITNALLAMNGYQYRCRLTGTCTPVVYSDAVTLTVINPITSSLPTTSFCPGSRTIPLTVTNFTSVASFSLTFSYDTAKLVYSGYQSVNTALSGGTFVANASGGYVYLSWSSTSAVTFGNGTLVEFLFTSSTGTVNLVWNTSSPGACEFTDANGGLLTSIYVNGVLTIHGVPAVVTQPVNRTIAKGQNTTFGITASGTGITYLWQVSTDGGSTWSDLANGGYYSNVTQPTMNITGAQLSLSGNMYRCRVSGTCQPVAYSDGALLTVLPNIITTCQTMSGCPGQLVVWIKVSDFIDVGAFSLALKYTSSVLTYSGYQSLNAGLAGGTFAGNAAGGTVYLSWSRTTTATIANNDTLVKLVFTGVTGTSSLTWDTGIPGNCEYNTGDGSVIFSTWVNGGVTVYQTPQVVTQPVNKTTYSGGSTSFTVTASATGIGYLWQVSTDAGLSWTSLANTTPYSGAATATLVINPATQALSGYLYRCRISGTCSPAVYSQAAQLTVTPGAVTTTASNITGSCTGNLTIPITVVNCTNVGGISLTLNYDTTKLIYNGYASLHSELTGGLMAVHAQAGKVRFSWASANSADIGSGTLVQFKFKATTGSSATLTWDTQTPGNCEYSYVDGSVATSFYVNGSITFTTNPLVISAGNDTTINAGGTAQLYGAATGGTLPYIYLWTPTAGLSNPSISNPLASPSSSVVYTLTVTDNTGCFGSEGVTVNVLGVPATLSLQDINVGNGQNVCYDATQTITVAGGGTYFTVQNGGSVVMIAGESIQFLPGTRVYQGGLLDAYITTTGQFCSTSSPSFYAAARADESTPKLDADPHSFFNVYPNPTSGNFVVELDDDSKSSACYLSVYGMMGNEVIKEKRIEGVIRVISLADQPAGMYIIRVHNDDQNQVKVLVKQ